MKKSCRKAALLLSVILLFPQAASPGRAEAVSYKEILLYVPNRVFDLLDIFRVRVRVGPGLSVGGRATRPASVLLGSHRTVYCGLPGPRGSRAVPLPVWFESARGPQIGPADLGGSSTHYDLLEVGLETQVFIVGINTGIGFFELADFAAGLLTIDLTGDDF